MRSPKIRYYLEKSRNNHKRQNPECVMAEVSYGYSKWSKNGTKRNVPFRISTKATIIPSNFGLQENNFKLDENIFQKYSRKNAFVKNSMHQVEMAVNKLSNHYLTQGITPTPEQFKSDVEQDLGRNILAGTQKSILQYLYDKIQNDRENSGSARKDALEESSIKIYVSLSHHIENYELHKNEKLYFESLIEEQYWEIWNVMDAIFRGEISVDNPNQKKKQRKNPDGYSVSTIQKNQKRFLRVLRQASKNDNIKINLNLDNENLVLGDTDSIKEGFYLDEGFLEKIIKSDVSHDEELQNAKDYVIIGGLTGLRFESMIKAYELPIHHCKEKETGKERNNLEYDFYYIYSDLNKTKNTACIPLLAPVLEVISRHNYSIPRFPSDINDRVKILFTQLEINQEVPLSKHTFKKGTIFTQAKISDIISTHDFRRSFYSNLIRKNVSPFVIEFITHPKKKHTKMAKYYNRISLLDKAKLFTDEIQKVNSSIYRF
jgi:hypothetical protein